MAIWWHSLAIWWYGTWSLRIAISRQSSKLRHAREDPNEAARARIGRIQDESADPLHQEESPSLFHLQGMGRSTWGDLGRSWRWDTCSGLWIRTEWWRNGMWSAAMVKVLDLWWPVVFSITRWRGEHHSWRILFAMEVPAVGDSCWEYGPTWCARDPPKPLTYYDQPFTYSRLQFPHFNWPLLETSQGFSSCLPSKEFTSHPTSVWPRAWFCCALSARMKGSKFFASRVSVVKGYLELWQFHVEGDPFHKRFEHHNMTITGNMMKHVETIQS